jgi:hypothetical protein
MLPVKEDAMKYLPPVVLLCLLAAFTVAGSIALRQLHETRRAELALLHAQFEAAERERAESWEWLRDSWLRLARHSRERTDEMLREFR